MTKEEAIEVLQSDKELYETDICLAGDGSPDGELLEAIDMAIEALSADAIQALKTDIVDCMDCKYYFNEECLHDDGLKGDVRGRYCDLGERKEVEE